jgi:hypothetical protein
MARRASETPPPLDCFLKGCDCRLVPMPGVLKSGYLGSGTSPVSLRKQHVVVGVRVERWVQVDQVHRLRGDVLPQNIEVVPVVEGVPAGHGLERRGWLRAAGGHPKKTPLRPN